MSRRKEIIKIRAETFPAGASGKEPTCQSRRRMRHQFDPWVRKIPWRKAWQPTPILLTGESHGQRNLAGYRPWGHKQLDTTEAIEHARTNRYRVFIFSNVYKSDFNPQLTQPGTKSASLVLGSPGTPESQENQVAHAGPRT